MLSTKIIGNKIAEARKKINISQSQLAERLFISSQAVGKWERGESMPDIITFNRLAEILEVDLNYFSENISSADTEIKAGESFNSQPESTSDEPEKRLSWDMSRGNWVGADFSGLKNLKEKFSASNMRRCLFIGSDLSGLLLKSNHVEDCDFSESDFTASRVMNTHSVSNMFKDCSLKETEFTGSHISRCNFTGADFTGVTVKASDFSKNTIVNTVWNHTSFIMSQLTNVVFDGTIDDCYFDNCSFKKVIFENAILLNTFFKSRSLKGIQFIDCKADRITYEFLKNGKADLNGITLIVA